MGPFSKTFIALQVTLNHLADIRASRIIQGPMARQRGTGVKPRHEGDTLFWDTVRGDPFGEELEMRQSFC